MAEFAKKTSEEASGKLTFIINNKFYLGDIICTNAICRNIKLFYPDAKVIFIVNKNLSYVAGMQKGVDAVIEYDRRGAHKGFFGLLKFCRDFKSKFPHEKIHGAIVIGGHFQNVLISSLLGAKQIVTTNDKQKKSFFKKFNRWFLAKFYNVTDHNIAERYVVDAIAEIIELFTNLPYKKLPIKCEIPEISESDLVASTFQKSYGKDDLIAVSPMGKAGSKCLPPELCCEIIKLLPKYKIVLTGVGPEADEYARRLRELGADFIDMTNKTTIPELAQILKLCKGIISVDTGTMHLAVALGIPTFGIFFSVKSEKMWSHKNESHPHFDCVSMMENFTAETLVKRLSSLLSE